MAGTGPLEGLGARVEGRPRRYHVVDDQPSFKGPGIPTASDGKGTLNAVPPPGGRLADLGSLVTAANQDIHTGSVPSAGQGPGQALGLIETPFPPSPSVEGHKGDGLGTGLLKPGAHVLGHPFGEPVGHAGQTSVF
jgi:hypothetical protein